VLTITWHALVVPLAVLVVHGGLLLIVIVRHFQDKR
jgi:hypothetical protein